MSMRRAVARPPSKAPTQRAPVVPTVPVKSPIEIHKDALATIGITNPSMYDIDLSMPMDEVYERIYGNNDIFTSAIFNTARMQEKEYMAGMNRSIKVIESIYKCTKCGYNRIVADQKQLRGGDESATTRFRCIKCGNQWSSSG